MEPNCGKDGAEAVVGAQSVMTRGLAGLLGAPNTHRLLLGFSALGAHAARPAPSSSCTGLLTSHHPHTVPAHAPPRRQSPSTGGCLHTTRAHQASMALRFHIGVARGEQQAAAGLSCARAAPPHPGLHSRATSRACPWPRRHGSLRSSTRPTSLLNPSLTAPTLPLPHPGPSPPTTTAG